MSNTTAKVINLADRRAKKEDEARNAPIAGCIVWLHCPKCNTLEYSEISMPDGRVHKKCGTMVEEEEIQIDVRAEYTISMRNSKRLDELLSDFHVSHLRNEQGVSLSGGERRRVEIARSLATDPLFILLDEPFAGVDPISVGDIQSIVQKLKEAGIGVLITDHNVQETLRICDRAYIVNEGRIISEGSAETVMSDDKVRSVYLGESFSL